MTAWNLDRACLLDMDVNRMENAEKKLSAFSALSNTRIRGPLSYHYLWNLKVNVSPQDLNDGPSQRSTGVSRGTRGQGIVTLLS